MRFAGILRGEPISINGAKDSARWLRLQPCHPAMRARAHQTHALRMSTRSTRLWHGTGARPVPGEMLAAQGFCGPVEKNDACSRDRL